MSFKSQFEKIAFPLAIDPRSKQHVIVTKDPTPVLSDYYKVMHSPTISGTLKGLKYGVPSAVIGALASPEGLRSRNALLLGGTIGALAGLAAAAQQTYSNATEKSHIMYHLDDR